MELRWRSVGVPAIEKTNSSGLKAWAAESDDLGGCEWS